MDKKIVGNEDCSFLDICSCISTAKTAGLLYRRWKDLARMLHVPSDTAIVIEYRLRSNCITYLEGLYELLECWRAVKSKEATLSNFIRVLQSLKLKEIADDLQKRFTPMVGHPSDQNEYNDLRFVKRVVEIIYDTSKKINEGVNFYTYKGKIQKLNVAVTKMPWDDEDELKKLIQEAEILRQLRGHPNIVEFYKIETDEHFSYMAFELCDGTLEQWLDGKINNIPRSAISSTKLLQQVSKGLEYLSQKNVVHRDLQPENILLRTANQVVVVKIADFGISRTLPRNLSQLGLKMGTGTIGWKAPEIIKTENATIVCRMARLAYLRPT